MYKRGHLTFSKFSSMGFIHVSTYSNPSTSHNMKLVVFSLLIGMAIGDSIYKPSGWRPTGPSFIPYDNRLHSSGYHNKPAVSYGPPRISPPVDVDQTRTTPIATTNTPRSRESTTPLNIDDDDDLQTNPALAIANSFAFNKPVFVYNGFPFHSAFTFVK